MKLRLFDLLALIFSILAFLSFTFYGRTQVQEASSLLIEDELGRSLYPLSEDREILLHGPVGQSLIIIEGESARFEHSDCSDELCVQMGSISRGGDWAACLPNKIFMHISGNESEGEVDAAVY